MQGLFRLAVNLCGVFLKLSYSIPEDAEQYFKPILRFFGIDVAAAHPATTIQDTIPDTGHVYFNGDCNDPLFSEWILKRFDRVVDFSGMYASGRGYMKSVEETVSITYSHKYFSHRINKAETTVKKQIELPVHTYGANDDNVLILVNGIPIVIYEETGGKRIVYSTINLFDKHSPLSIFKLRHIDWFWRSIEIVTGMKLRHHKWADTFSMRFDDVIGDCGFDFLLPLCDIANKTLLAVDINAARETFYNELLPKCGEVCAHACSHYKYTPMEKTELIYMNWEGGEYSADQLDKYFGHYDKFFSDIPSDKRSTVLSAHGFQTGKAALDYLQRRGIRYIITPFLPGEQFTAAPHEAFESFPYNNINYHITRYSDDMSLFYHTGIKKHFDTWNSPRGYKLHVRESSSTDFLYGIRLFKPPDMYFAPVRVIIKRLERLMDDCSIVGFPLILFTHETSIGYLGKKGWAELAEYITGDISKCRKAMKPSEILTEMQKSNLTDMEV
ncbi:hypothetical protein [Candidatus Magnetominusculus xianensis]|uniref:Polysaccharide deacetylase n=1 Tax=Candidatus Magnetominusculus xianensis TaxID=1748249 RepID=A0ABR5SEZ8_9BACT|nr:hypothetical protein [Candidatus Magnetominusculus xianensis]KWT85311.1 hypothetical protein ASN18_1768 [Candidatus Magnetominusculus xianensis]MBF0404822.1 hypothetical protein [Nitrospirota bacterium]